MTRAVVVTGGGALGPAGAGVEPLLDAVLAGRTALVRGDRACAARLAAEPAPGPVPANVWRRLDRCSRMALVAVREAIEDAGLARDQEIPDAAGLVVGTMTGGVESLQEFLGLRLAEGPEGASPILFPLTVPNAAASQCSILLALRGPNLTVSEMEASGLAAIATGAGLIRDGVCDVVVAGGADEWVGEFDRAWSRLHLTHRGAPEEFAGPFGRRRRGFVPGEGAFFVVLESGDAAERRGARVWAEIAGAGMTHAAGAAHDWPSGPEAAADAMGLALERARLRPEEVGCVFSAANGSRRLDALETRALRRTFGPALRRVPVTSVKGGVGESGSASSCAALVGALSIRDGFIPPVAGLVDPDPGLDLNLVTGRARRQAVPSVLVEAQATGGGCVALVLKRRPGTPA